MRDGAQVLDNLVARHTDARVADGEGARVFVALDRDLQLRVGIDHVAVGQQLELHAAQRVGRVGDQLAQENVPVGVQRMNQDVQQLLDFGFEFVRFSCHECSLVRMCVK